MAASFSLAGKVALVTGANTGLGEAIAVALARSRRRYRRRGPVQRCRHRQIGRSRRTALCGDQG